MCDTPFKTPRLPRQAPKSTNSDSEESTTSDSASTRSSVDLTIVALYDDFKRLIDQKLEDNERLRDSFHNFAEETKLMYLQWKQALAECHRLGAILEEKIVENSDMKKSLFVARTMMDEEKKKRRCIQAERDNFQVQIARFCNELVKDHRNKLADETKEQMRHLNSGRMSFCDPDRLTAIKEINSTGSVLSDFSFSRSEDDLDSSICTGKKSVREWTKRQPVPDKNVEPATKKRRSSTNKVIEIGTSETVRATTTLMVTKDGPITATSVIESVPMTENEGAIAPSELVFESWNREGAKFFTPTTEKQSNLRQHFYQQKTVVMPESCQACEKKIGFSRTALKCRECKALCHLDCRNLMPLPCVPIMNTPGSKKFTGTIADYTPTSPPLVPSLIVHCVNEIEQRGLEELGVYRVPGSEKDVKGLKEKFVSGRSTPSLKDVDVHVICGCVKDFLRSLKEPLTTYALWHDFVQAARAKHAQDVEPILYETVAKLPRPNRDTLAFVILHLQKVAQAVECKMPKENLAKVFGPTVVGYSSEDPDPNRVFQETRDIVKVMECLLDLPSDYWSRFVNVTSKPTVVKLQQTPSTDSLLRPTANRFFTPGGRGELGKWKRRKEGRMFATPPSYRT
ncbi:unnamed protein product [Phaedon cochleariae]|uniref:Rac GTPase-activating protein 1 n=1 Tax=Phaedon cochleariae TaxID=80249 RepID=A0A9N9SDW9_PHACE|nr:unnamed protein product [Phaedon cochleariae]